MVIFGFNILALLLFPLLILQETVYIYVQAKPTAEVPEREIEIEPAQQCVWVTKEMAWHGSQKGQLQQGRAGCRQQGQRQRDSLLQSEVSLAAQIRKIHNTVL